ncbi:MAG: sugar phosphate isomerase/epimerase [Cyclobacteriaceae bacterium]|nr:sugar phosphate isomerase/epimerase [Cyclobacteriaceae bacterium]
MERRKFIISSTLGMGILGLDPANALGINKKHMGVIVHSYAKRWQSKIESNEYPGFADATDLIAHCHQIGAGGVQVMVRGWTKEFSKKVRDQREKLGLFLEGSVSLPKTPADVSDFEKEVINAREAGARILRTVCLNGRRYETFKSAEDFQEFKKQSIAALQRAEPIVRKHKMKLAVENHKDWRADELVAIIKNLDSAWVGVTLDFGNSISLLENPMEVVNALTPYVFSTHVKDMALEEYDKGFLLSEVPLGQGILDLKAIIAQCKRHNPDINFNLEMITRDPLEVPCLTEEYWATFEGIGGMELARTLSMVREHKTDSSLPQVSHLNDEQRLMVEENNVLECLEYSREVLDL